MDGYISFMTDYKFAPPPSDRSPAVLAWQVVQTPSPKETRAYAPAPAADAHTAGSAPFHIPFPKIVRRSHTLTIPPPPAPAVGWVEGVRACVTGCEGARVSG
jgi:hypothetical protein